MNGMSNVVGNLAVSSNVIGLKNDSPLESINLFVSIKRSKSKNTAKSYIGFYKEFFMYTLGKELNEVTWDLIMQITYKDVLHYQKYLSERENVNRTINNKTIALRSLWKHLKRDNKQIDETVFDVEMLNEITKDTRHGSLTESEFSNLLEFCNKQKQKSHIKRAYFQAAMTLTLRKQCLLDLKWGDIKQKLDSKTGNQIWTVCSWDKGTEILKGITDEYYEELCLLKTLTTTKDSHVFEISDKTLAKTLHEFTESYGIPSDRNIVIHSLKSSSVDKIWNDTKNILLCSTAASHKNITTTYNSYIGKNSSLSESSSYTMYEKADGLDKLEALSKEELLELIGKSKWVVSELIKSL